MLKLQNLQNKAFPNVKSCGSEIFFQFKILCNISNKLIFQMKFI